MFSTQLNSYETVLFGPCALYKWVCEKKIIVTNCSQVYQEFVKEWERVKPLAGNASKFQKSYVFQI